MHGVVMRGLQQFVVEEYDRSTWKEIKTETTDRSERYMPLKEYPDEELLSIIESAADELEHSREELLIEFGISLMDDLLDMYFVYFDDDWDALDVIEHVEEAIHESLRARSLSTFTPPKLQTKRASTDAVVIKYTSDRQLCEFARGLIRGLAEAYDDPLEISEPRCMHNGDPYCVLVVERQSDPFAEL